MLMKMDLIDSDNGNELNESSYIGNDNDSGFIDISDVPELLDESDKKYEYEISYYKAKYFEPILISLGNEFYQNKSKRSKYKPNQGKVNATVSCFICNALRALSYDIEEMKISLNKNNYGKKTNRDNKIKPVSFDIHNELLIFLEENDYIKVHRGFWLQDTVCESTITLLEKTKNCLESYKGKSRHFAINDSVILRKKSKSKSGSGSGSGSGSKKHNVKIEDNLITIDSKNLLKSWNELSLKTEIKINGKAINNVQYRRIFIDNFECGGRYYDMYGKIQTLSKDKRKLITHNGKKTKELDYKSIHPSILYDKNHIKFVGEFEPYGMELENFGIFDKSKNIKTDARTLAKNGMMSIINSKSTPEAIGSINKMLREDLLQVDPQKRKYSHLPTYMNAESVFFEICRVNEKISDYFGSGIGIELQFLDSQIATYIIKHFTEQGILVQCIHDSFIIQEDKADELYDVMKEAYLNVIGSNLNCRIE